jgi:tRNA(Phe) wybutosine-synthesizing methylase Tyw3
MFSGAITAVLVVVHLRIHMEKKKNDVSEDGDATPLCSPGFILHPRCGSWYCAYALLNGPLVV